MEYHGKLYGKIGNKYFDTGKTSKDFDEILEILKELLELKQLKFNDGEYPSEEYIVRKPIAWEKAKQLLTKITQ